MNHVNNIFDAEQHDAALTGFGQSGQPQVVVVTGYSGAGKSTVLRALEDLGFFCVDNLPIALLSSFFHLVVRSKDSGQRIALGLDVRAGDSLDQLVHELHVHNTSAYPKVHIVFLSCNVNVLIKRFQETRRKHPLIQRGNLQDAIEYEQELLKPLSSIADLFLDTDALTIHQLRTFVQTLFAGADRPTMMVTLISFGFKYGLPQESNFVFDLRSLPNPYFIADLKGLSGTDQRVRDYLFAQSAVQDYWDRFYSFCSFAIKRAYQEGRFFMNIAIGCTGGRHRSVAFVERLSHETFSHVKLVVHHRDINNDIKFSREECAHEAENR